MTNAELIRALRETDFGYVCEHCEHEDMCRNNDCVIIQASDALEAAEKRIDGLQKLVDINTERCEALRKQLRESHEDYEKHINELTTKCNQLQAAVDNYEKRIAELEAQLPKEGEWIDIDGTMFAKCSVCGKRHYGCTTPYCDMCGAKMKGENDGES